MCTIWPVDTTDEDISWYLNAYGFVKTQFPLARVDTFLSLTTGNHVIEHRESPNPWQSLCQNPITDNNIYWVFVVFFVNTKNKIDTLFDLLGLIIS